MCIYGCRFRRIIRKIGKTVQIVKLSEMSVTFYRSAIHIFFITAQSCVQYLYTRLFFLHPMHVNVCTLYTPGRGTENKVKS